MDYSWFTLFIFVASGLLTSSEIKATNLPTMKIDSPKPIAGSALVSRESMNLFISGHSLTDQPIPDHLEAIADSLRTSLAWNRQYVVGSSIMARSRGKDLQSAIWSGYRSGFNKSGQGLDVVAELRNPQTIKGAKYDVLLITEQHGLLDTLSWNDTVRYLRHFHDRLIDGNPQGSTYFYESWISLNDKNDPRRWIAYERAASPIWQCIATRINSSLALEGRADRIMSLPAGLALASLIETAISPQGIPGISLSTVRETVDSFIKDDVHLTELGSYYIALVSYSFTFGRSATGAWHPSSVSEIQTQALQRKAWEFISNYSNTNVPLTLQECQTELRASFIGTYWTYVRDTYWLRDSNLSLAYLRWLRSLVRSHWQMRNGAAENPFRYKPESDKDYWLPAP